VMSNSSFPPPFLLIFFLGREDIKGVGDVRHIFLRGVPRHFSVLFPTPSPPQMASKLA